MRERKIIYREKSHPRIHLSDAFKKKEPELLSVSQAVQKLESEVVSWSQIQTFCCRMQVFYAVS